ncbi:Hypp6178 [Branchiostoma lanceolatum]|uniref:Hypp6178 protein n=1 Tax=Branchiostoma lanceolatum TaxID=7740 RepID=A0A8J9YQ43_BRALA|nr:Hypp6178 [Branchiostoma lanceolatum]
MLAMQDQHLGEVKTLSHRGGQRVYFVKHDILGLPDADKTAAIVALAQHGVNIKEYADTLVDSEAEVDMNKSIEANEVIAGEKRCTDGIINKKTISTHSKGHWNPALEEQMKTTKTALRKFHRRRDTHNLNKYLKEKETLTHMEEEAQS